jgi:hypothetical protein
MTGVMACCSILSFSILMVGNKIIQYKAKTEDVKEETAEMISTL